MLLIDHLKVGFSSEDNKMVRAVNGVCLELGRGRTLAVIGESGSGKSIMGLALCGLLPPKARMSGRVIFQGKSMLDLPKKEIRAMRGRQIAFVPQSAGLSLNPTTICGAQVAEVFTRRFGRSLRQAGKLTRTLFSGLNLEKTAYFSYPHRLSGGMRQRVLTGIGLAGTPDLLIADEPTKGIDHFRRDRVVDLFKEVRIRNPNISIFLITHDIDLAERLADEVAVMYGGKVMEVSPAADFFTRPYHPYSRALLNAMPQRGLQPIPGLPSSPRDRVSGCVFHPRCTRVQTDCAVFEPGGVRDGSSKIWCLHHAHP